MSLKGINLAPKRKAEWYQKPLSIWAKLYYSAHSETQLQPTLKCRRNVEAEVRKIRCIIELNSKMPLKYPTEWTKIVSVNCIFSTAIFKIPNNFKINCHYFRNIFSQIVFFAIFPNYELNYLINKLLLSRNIFDGSL